MADKALNAAGAKEPEDTRWPGALAECNALPSFGDYEIIGEIAQGATSVVLQARQRSLNRLVALKVLRDGVLAEHADVRRFQREADAVAQLDHPHIVPIYEVGVSLGFCYFSMKLLAGGNLAQRLPELAADPCAAAKLVATIARAVHHAHQRGVLHRDLKPSNILLDHNGQPHVTDFGLARRIEFGPELTQTGAVLGTPAYMAPEQVDGSKYSVTAATDVYGLGAVLYTILAGRPPLHGDSIIDTLTQVKDREPAPLRGGDSRIDRDLETICLTCLRKDPAQRYASAAALADDIERWLRGAPIAARPIGRPTRVARWCRRNPAIASAFLLTVVALALSSIAVLEHAQLKERQRLDAERTLANERQKREMRYVSEIRSASKLLKAGSIREAEAALDRLRPQRGENDTRSFAWFYLHRLLHNAETTLTGHVGPVNHAAFSPDGHTLATAGHDRTVRLWDVISHETRALLTGHTGAVNWVAFSPDGKALATASSDGTIRLWELSRERGMTTFDAHNAEVLCVAFTPDGRGLISAGRDKKVKRWDVATRKPVATWENWPYQLQSLAIASAGSTMALAGSSHTVSLFDWRKGERLHQIDTGLPSVLGVAISHAGGLFAAPTTESRAIVWDVTGRLRTFLQGHDRGVSSLAFSPDDKTIATASDDGTARLWDVPPDSDWNVPAAHPRQTLAGHRARVTSVTFSPHGETVATTSLDGTAKLWGSRRPVEPTTLYSGSPITSVAFSADGQNLSLANVDSLFQTWDVATAQCRRQLILCVQCPQSDHSSYQGYSPVLSPSAETVAVDMIQPDVLCLCKLRTDEPRVDLRNLERLGVYNTVPRFFSPDGKRLATAHRDRIRLWDVSTGRELRCLNHPRGMGYSWPIAFSGQGNLLAAVNCGTPERRYQDGWTAVWDLTDGRTLISKTNKIPVRFAAFSPDSRILAILHNDALELLDPLTLMKRGSLQTSAPQDIRMFEFSPDGRTLATAGSEPSIRLWDVATGQELLALDDPPFPVFLRFSPDGRALACASVAKRDRIGPEQGLFSGQSEPAQSDRGPVTGVSKLVLWRTATDAEDRTIYPLSSRP